MERDFEQEFRKLKQDEIPDLWNRIEAGLSEKKSVASAPGNVIAIDNRKRTEKKTFAWRKWATLAAACVCVVVILPALSQLFRSKSYSGSANDTAMNTAMEEAACDTAAEESPENMTGMADTTAAVEEAAAADGGDIDAAASAESIAEGTAEAEAIADESAEAEAVADNAAEEEKAVWDDLTDGQILEEAVIQIQKAEIAGEEVFYQAVVLRADTDHVLECETQIALVCNADTEYDFLRVPRDQKKLKEQETYQVTLRYDAKNERLIVLAAENWEE